MKYLLILFFINFGAFSQTKGVVIDNSGNPIPYVNIWVDGEILEPHLKKTEHL